MRVERVGLHGRLTPALPRAGGDGGSQHAGGKFAAILIWTFHHLGRSRDRRRQNPTGVGAAQPVERSNPSHPKIHSLSQRLANSGSKHEKQQGYTRPRADPVRLRPP